MPESLIDRLWYGRSIAAMAARTALAPLEMLYRTGVRVRTMLYDHAVLRTTAPAIPVLSVGNLTAGGTGKTPVSAWFARRLLKAGARPGIIMRGYGNDEPLVHARINPEVRVVVAPDRLAGARTAAANGADCAVLDDAFQHRQVARTADVVLVSADRWDGRERLLPAGPWREPLGALRRATLVLVTRKAVDAEKADAALRAIRRHTGAETGVIALRLHCLAAAGEDQVPLETLRGRRVLAISAIGDPGAFERQLEAQGAVVRSVRFADHHRFTAEEAQALAASLTEGEMAVCTLKDHVKVHPLWPRASGTLWYVSLRVVPESGEGAIQATLDAVLRARTAP